MWGNHLRFDIEHLCINRFLSNWDLHCLLCAARVSEYNHAEVPSQRRLHVSYSHSCRFPNLLICAFLYLFLSFFLPDSHWSSLTKHCTAFQLRWWHSQLPDSSPWRCQWIENYSTGLELSTHISSGTCLSLKGDLIHMLRLKKVCSLSLRWEELICSSLQICPDHMWNSSWHLEAVCSDSSGRRKALLQILLFCCALPCCTLIPKLDMHTKYYGGSGSTYFKSATP